MSNTQQLPTDRRAAARWLLAQAKSDTASGHQLRAEFYRYISAQLTCCPIDAKKIAANVPYYIDGDQHAVDTAVELLNGIR